MVFDYDNIKIYQLSCNPLNIILADEPHFWQYFIIDVVELNDEFDASFSKFTGNSDAIWVVTSSCKTE